MSVQKGLYAWHYSFVWVPAYREIKGPTAPQRQNFSNQALAANVGDRGLAPDREGFKKALPVLITGCYKYITQHRYKLGGICSQRCRLRWIWGQKQRFERKNSPKIAQIRVYLT